ncbi:hypothetical protein CTAYLR_001114 [Chrysophaeum taylorii]|uniref:peptidylprolyl isomerase n=1 Tax=Chrysophaeum taylorii TaxID=2483200 RepID=A0AAD7UPR3_9STRA|nr:hypothetical protein CTAYLR_001114 [Chrysophaeum taylorii]
MFTLLFCCLAAADVYHVKFSVQVRKGDLRDFVVEVHPSWAPLGAARFAELVDANFFSGCRFFRVVENFVAQFGISGKPGGAAWEPIPDDPVVETNAKYTVTFATSGPDSRTTQIFVNLADNSRLDAMSFAPFGKVISGSEVVDAIYSGYGEKPQQARIREEGNAYLKKQFPNLSYVAEVARLDGSPAEEP